MNEFASPDLSDRLRRATGTFALFRDHQSRRFWTRIGGGLVAAAGALAYGVVVFFCFTEGQAEPAGLTMTAMNACFLQIWFLCRVAPAVFPYDALVRRDQLYLPIRQSVIIRRWWNGTKIAAVVCAGAMTAVAGGVLACGVPAVAVATNWAWQLVVLAASAQLIYVVVSHCGRMGVIFTTVFWIYAAMSFFGAQALFAFQQTFVGACLCGPFYLILLIPQFVADAAGEFATLALALLMLIGCLLRQGGPIQPSWSRLRGISRSRRQLPDRESPRVGELNYPRGDVASTAPPASNSDSDAEQIRLHIAIPRPMQLVEPDRRVRYRVLAILLVLAHASITTLVDVLHRMNHAADPPGFAMSAIFFHLPAMWGVFQLAPMVRSRLLNIAAMMRIGLRGMLLDTIVLALIFLPSIFCVGTMGGDFVSPALHVTNCLMVAALVRVAWIPLAAFPYEWINAHVACCAGMLTFLVGGAGLGILQWLLGWNHPEWIFLLPLSVGLGVLAIGWDRIAAQIRRRSVMHGVTRA